jgi:Raf kinase inhibitor-like YbhB/YbcL family protein
MNLRILIIAIVLATTTFSISSPEFKDRGDIPKRCTCQGDNYNPEIDLTDFPAETKSLVIIMDDPDVIINHNSYVHWLVWNIPPTNKIEENNILGIAGKNSSGKYGYAGPCPVSGVHRYYISVYALNDLLHLEKDADRKTVEKSMTNHIIAKSELMGYYEKNSAFLIFY